MPLLYWYELSFVIGDCMDISVLKARRIGFGTALLAARNTTADKKAFDSGVEAYLSGAKLAQGASPEVAHGYTACVIAWPTGFVAADMRHMLDDYKTRIGG
jgi:hypothetical protein